MADEPMNFKPSSILHIIPYIFHPEHLFCIFGKFILAYGKEKIGKYKIGSESTG
ncbi:hypothetical protein QF042_002437 [Pedobacter sp. W3I1]|nr:hypothetical protein [Pedobacter sp. W3I1]